VLAGAGVALTVRAWVRRMASGAVGRSSELCAAVPGELRELDLGRAQTAVWCSKIGAALVLVKVLRYPCANQVASAHGAMRY
jgi:hypothetical protein